MMAALPAIYDPAAMARRVYGVPALVDDALAQLDGAGGADLIRRATEVFAGRLAITSSFGADSALLLAMVAEIDPTIPVLFLQTERHFPETLAYRTTLAKTLGLRDVRDIRPDPEEASAEDADGDLWLAADACCGLRKVRPLRRALSGFDAWITGRRRDQASTRHTLQAVEMADGRVKLNPLAGWDTARMGAEFRRRNLPRHPLAERGFASIGCAPCTVAVPEGADPRGGRWSGRGKIECGIHQPPTHPIARTTS